MFLLIKGTVVRRIKISYITGVMVISWVCICNCRESNIKGLAITMYGKRLIVKLSWFYN